MERIAVLGAGLMGHGIAQVFAVMGHSVTLMDIDEEALNIAPKKVRDNLSLMADNGIGSKDDIDSAVERIQTTNETKTAVDGAQFVFEAAVENLTVKQKIFQDLDFICPPETILASNTSVISITEIAAKARYPERIVGTHFWNPPYLVPLVEIVKAEHTSEATMDAAYALLKRAGKHPVKVEKDVPGFVGNRLQHALWREAVSIVQNGIADAATVDECVKYGFGLRLPVLGPLENADMVGTDLALAIHDYLLEHLESSPSPSPLLKELVSEGKLGFKSGQGFRTWSKEEIEQSRKNLQEYLLEVTKG